MLVDEDAGVIPGHDDIAQDCEGCVVAGRGCDASRTVGRLGRWRSAWTLAVDPPERVNDFETAAERIECRCVFLLLTQHLACGRSRQWSCSHAIMRSCSHAVMQSWPRAVLVRSTARSRNEQAREVGCASLGSNPMRPPETPESSSASANSR
jgi:hypothetical protein